MPKEYIERETAKKVLADDYAYAAADLLDTVPTADVAEVKHGKWVKNQEDIYWGNHFIRRNCSICGGAPIYQEGLGAYKLTPYCPYCGAKMDKE